MARAASQSLNYRRSWGTRFKILT